MKIALTNPTETPLCINSLLTVKSTATMCSNGAQENLSNLVSFTPQDYQSSLSSAVSLSPLSNLPKLGLPHPTRQPDTQHLQVQKEYCKEL